MDPKSALPFQTTGSGVVQGSSSSPVPHPTPIQPASVTYVIFHLHRLKATILVPSSYNTNTINWEAYKNKLISHSSGRWKSPRSRHQHVWKLVRAHFLVPSLLTASSHGRRGKGALWGLLCKSANSIHMGSVCPHDLITPQRPDPLMLSH